MDSLDDCFLVSTWNLARYRSGVNLSVQKLHILTTVLQHYHVTLLILSAYFQFTVCIHITLLVLPRSSKCLFLYCFWISKCSWDKMFNFQSITTKQITGSGSEIPIYTCPASTILIFVHASFGLCSMIQLCSFWYSCQLVLSILLI